MFHLTQYIVVRRDLPTMEDVLVQAGHAAGKAMFCYAARLAHEGHAGAKWETLERDWGHPSRIFKGARNEDKLKKLAAKIAGLGIDHVTVTEPDDGPLKGQITALSLFPGEKEPPARLLNDFQHLRWPDVPAFAAAVGAGRRDGLQRALHVANAPSVPEALAAISLEIGKT